MDSDQPDAKVPRRRRIRYWWLLCLPVVAAVALVIMLSGSSQPARASAVYTGQAFDTCGAPSSSSMQSWLSSPYRGIGIYIGGANRACGDGNLSAGWVSAVQSQGWQLAPLYVGLQAPCVFQGGLATIDPGSASTEGTQAADDAASRASVFGLGAGTPIYFDMEGYNNGAGGCTGTVVAFLNAWTNELHRLGLVSGVYGSSASTIHDLAANFGPSSPDDVWFASWDGDTSVFGDPSFPDSLWANHQRIHQYQGGVTQTYGGVTLNIDQDFSDGAVVGPGCVPYTSLVGTYSVCGAILQHYLALGGPQGFLGYPIDNETPTPDGIGRYNYFSNNGAIYWTPSTGAQSIHGEILTKWSTLNYEKGVLGYPITDETGTPDGIGRYNYFSNDGSIYWTPNGGAWSIHGAIQDHWASLGYERGVLGYPMTDENGTPDGIGRYNHFSSTDDPNNLDGSIFWTPSTGAWSIHGAIRTKWASMGWEHSVLGYPIKDETGTPDGIGRFNYFSNDGSIYWTPNAGAWSIHGAIQDHWASLSYERGVLGYPMTDETGTSDGVGRFNNFSSTDDPNNQDGSIYWTPSTGAWSVHGAIRTKWASMGSEKSCLGYPTSDEFAISGGRQSNFQNGDITYSFSTGVATSTC
jgi:hypothetical protein